jgi:hypothetical protein
MQASLCVQEKELSLKRFPAFFVFVLSASREIKKNGNEK